MNSKQWKPSCAVGITPFPLAEANEAVAALRGGAIAGAAVLTV